MPQTACRKNTALSKITPNQNRELKQQLKSNSVSGNKLLLVHQAKLNNFPIRWAFWEIASAQHLKELNACLVAEIYH